MNKHDGFWTDIDGTPIHVQGDPNMSDETLTALKEMAQAAIKAMETHTIPDSTDWPAYKRYMAEAFGAPDGEA